MHQRVLLRVRALHGLFPGICAQTHTRTSDSDIHILMSQGTTDMANSDIKALSISYSPASGNGTLQFWRQSLGSTSFVQTGIANGGTNLSEHLGRRCLDGACMAYMADSRHAQVACVAHCLDDCPTLFVHATKFPPRVECADAGQILILQQGAELFALQSVSAGAIYSYNINLVDGTAQLTTQVSSSGHFPMQGITTLGEDYLLVVNYGAGSQTDAVVLPINSGEAICS